MAKTFDLREATIKMNGIRNASMPYHFFYDETENIAKLRLKEGKLNVREPVCFVLGGLMSKQNIALPDLNFFKSILGLKKSVTELKSKYLGKAKDLAYLGSSRTTAFLDWACAQDFFIHWLVLDPLYWGIVDIVDSAMEGMEINTNYIVLNRGVKADLHAVLRDNLEEMERVFSCCKFPNVSATDLEALYNDLISIAQGTEAIPKQNAIMTVHVLKRGLKIKGTTFLGGLEDNLLLESLDAFYANRIMLFKEANHTFDNEERIVERLSNGCYDTIIHAGTKKQFVDSKTEIGVQISDFIVSIYGRYFSWLNGMTYDDLLPKLTTLNPIQKANLKKMKLLMDKSDDESNGLFSWTVSGHLIEKHNRAMIWVNF